MDYAANMKAGQRDIYYLAAPSRQLAENSPYYEALKVRVSLKSFFVFQSLQKSKFSTYFFFFFFQEKDVDVLFCYESYDELVLMQLQQFDQKRLTSVEKEFRQTPEDAEKTDSKASMDLSNWIQAQLGTKVAKVKLTQRLASHPCVITGIN